MDVVCRSFPLYSCFCSNQYCVVNVYHMCSKLKIHLNYVISTRKLYFMILWHLKQLRLLSWLPCWRWSSGIWRSWRMVLLIPWLSKWGWGVVCTLFCILSFWYNVTVFKKRKQPKYPLRKELLNLLFWERESSVDCYSSRVQCGLLF